MGDAGFERPLTAQEAVLREFRRNIVTGRWAPGTPIRQDTVAADLGVSRVPVREALKILEGEDQVTYVPHKGYLVRRFDTEELLEVYRLRELLEAEAVRAAVPCLTEADLDRMYDAMVAMERLQPDDIAGIVDANREFHTALFSAASMPRLGHLVRLLRDWADAYRAILYEDLDGVKRSCEEHRVIYDACRSRDTDRVIELLAQHRARTVETLTSVLADGAASPREHPTT